VGGQVLLGNMMIGMNMRVLVALTVTKSARITVAIHQVGGHGADAFVFDQLADFKKADRAVGLWRGCQIEGRLDDGKNPFGQTDILIYVGSG